ncbi:MAG: cytochrome c biogenesis protein CcdA, partial [Actinobacteria bacterium]|nr:cytochrome c biogenesis protein CcdA [Actinomycetota bacterium]
MGVVVTSLSLWAFGIALLAGLLSFLSPCVLPLVPVYLSYVSGVGVERLNSERSQVMRTALMFVLGFTLVFMTLGASAGSIGQILVRHDRALA